MRLHKPSPSMAVALVALVFSMTGTGIAAEHYLITSKSQIKPSVLAQLKGNPGSTGAQGTNGAQGLPGQSVVGTEGRAGISIQGPEGKSGANGSKGEVGLTGTTGPQGPEGKTGPSGPQGTEGEAGQTGPQGPKGEMGATGPEGKASPMPRSFLLEGPLQSDGYPEWQKLPAKTVTLASHEIKAGESYIVDATVLLQPGRGAEGGDRQHFFYECWVGLITKSMEGLSEKELERLPEQEKNQFDRQIEDMGQISEPDGSKYVTLHAYVSGPGVVVIQCQGAEPKSTFEYEEETTQDGAGGAEILKDSGTGVQVATPSP